MKRRKKEEKVGINQSNRNVQNTKIWLANAEKFQNRNDAELATSECRQSTIQLR